KGGFDGDVVVALVDMPAGIYCEPLLLKQKEASSGLMLISASPDAPLGMFPLHLIASGKVGDRIISRQLLPKGVSKSAPEVYLSVLETAPFSILRLGDPAGNDPKKTAAEIADDNKGPGRADDGNFVLSDLEVYAAPNGDESKRTLVDLKSAKVDFVQGGFDINMTLNTREPGHQSGWAVFPQVAQSHWGVWNFNKTVGNEAGTTVWFRLNHRYGKGRFIFRQFRILVSDKEN